jgi:hypothetical protein
MLPCPQFIEREVFEGVQQMLAEAKQMHNGRPATKHLLCRYLRCRKCGRRYRSRTQHRYAAYICGNYDYKLHRQLCRTPEIRCSTLEAVVWSAIWRHLTQPELLLTNTKAYYDSLPSTSGTAKLERELATVTSRMERTQRMVRFGTEDEQKGNALILQDKQRITEIQTELRAAGSILSLPSARVVEAGCRRRGSRT